MIYHFLRQLTCPFIRTLDDVDIFQQKTPFSPTDLIHISSFLNSFYFTLISQQHSTAELPPAAAAFKSARRLLLQIYDLDLHHPFCPSNHWLLISSMSTGMKSFFSNLLLNDNNNNTSKLFLTNLRMGDPVPLRILQLMPHTVSFDMRLKIFRDWIALDRSVTPKTMQRFITVRRDHILEDGFNQLAGLPASAWKGTIRVSFVNELGVGEIGIDQGGPFKGIVVESAYEEALAYTHCI
jgi:ubiquitin-protein ligase E3 B